MTEPIQSDYADLLNALDDMQRSGRYALRRGVLQAAEQTIVHLEQENLQLREQLKEREK